MSSRDLVVAAAGASAPSDPQFNNVSLLLSGDGTNGAQNNTFLDSSTNNFTITRNGNTTQGTFSPYGNRWSNYFDGTGDYLQITSNSAFNMNTYCSFEAWVCYSSLGTDTLISGRDSSYWLAYNFTGIGGTSNKFVFTINNGSSWQAVSSTTTPSVGVWYHVVGVKDGSTLRIYINGVQENTASFSGSPTTLATVFGIGANQNTQNMDGYISNVRLILGSSSGVLPYTSNFTPSTTPLTAVSGTSLLTCQSNRFKDNSSNNFAITVNGNPSAQRFSPFNPTAPYSTATIGGSGYFDGSGDYLNTTTASSDFGTGDFTIEAWVYQTSNSSERCIISRHNGGSDWVFKINSGYLYTYPANQTGTTLLNLNAWNHVAWSRQSGTSKFWVNGVQDKSWSDSTNYSSSNNFYNGAQQNNTAGTAFLGYMNGVRVVTGTSLYNSTFTPPTSPLTAISNTQLLLSYTNAGIPDAAMMNDLETVGNAQVSTSVKKYGTGSLAFDGTGDYLQIADNAALDLGGGQYTIEAWVYPTALNNYDCIIGKWGGTAEEWLLYYENGQFRLMQSGYNYAYKAWTATNQWIHIAAVYDGTNTQIYVNGQSGTSFAGNGISNSTQVVTIGGYNRAGTWQYFDGYIDDLRITKGYARYTANFTPPAQALPTN